MIPIPSSVRVCIATGHTDDHAASLQQFGVFLVELDELDQVFDSEVGERLDAVFSDAIDPDDAVFDLHFYGDVAQPVFFYTRSFATLV